MPLNDIFLAFVDLLIMHMLAISVYQLGRYFLVLTELLWRFGRGN